MPMFSPTDQNPFRAVVQLDQSDITDFLMSALTREGYTDVSITFKVVDNGSRWDRNADAPPTLNATATGSKDGRPETEVVSSAQIQETVEAELKSAGHSVDDVTINYSDMRRQVYGHFVLLVPRKRCG